MIDRRKYMNLIIVITVFIAIILGIFIFGITIYPFSMTFEAGPITIKYEGPYVIVLIIAFSISIILASITALLKVILKFKEWKYKKEKD